MCNCIVLWEPMTERHVWLNGSLDGSCGHPPTGTPYESTDDDLTEDDEREMAAQFDRARGYHRPRSERAAEQRRLFAEMARAAIATAAEVARRDKPQP